MQRLSSLLIVILLILPISIWATPTRPAPLYPVVTGSEQVNAPVAMPPYPETSPLDETDLIGDTTTIGMTWYESQHNGTCGRMNTLEPSGWRQFCWMKGENSGASIRHIWWNGIDPGGIQVFPGNGVAVESSTRGGFVNMDFCHDTTYIAYQATMQSGSTRIIVAKGTHQGFFFDYELPPAPFTVLWPRIQVNQNGNLQIVATSQGAVAGNPQRQYSYNSQSSTWTFMDWTQTIAADVATSPVPGNNKVLWAWTRSREYGADPPNPDSAYSQLNNDIYYLIDADGLNPNFNLKVNLTHFIPPDTSLLPDTLHANKDTLRAYTDLGCFIDHNNFAHIVFTTRSYFQIQGTSYWNASLIWHWSEQWPDSFRVVGDESYFGYNNNVNCGAWNLKAQRPSLGEDAQGNLYCMYQVYDTDTMHLSLAGYPSGEIYMSVSTDGGLHWSQAVNVTYTITPHNAPAGQCRSELTPTMAKKVDAYCHIQYVYDLDAGNVVQTEGSWTNNPVRYHRVPVAQIPITPLVVQTKHLHVSSGPPQIEFWVTPIHPPIVIPAIGGSFQFTVSAINHGPNPASISVWARIQYPSGTYSPPILGPVLINLPVGVLVSRVRTQNVPARWPPGNYHFIGYVHWGFGYPVTDSSWFTFTKSVISGLGPWISDSSCTGEPFPGEAISLQPSAFTLLEASPNPFNPATTISFKLQAASHISLKVYDTAGRLVATLEDRWSQAGTHCATFDGSKLASGIYLCTLTAGGNTASRKMVLLK